MRQLRDLGKTFALLAFGGGMGYGVYYKMGQHEEEKLREAGLLPPDNLNQHTVEKFVDNELGNFSKADQIQTVKTDSQSTVEVKQQEKDVKTVSQSNYEEQIPAQAPQEDMISQKTQEKTQQSTLNFENMQQKKVLVNSQLTNYSNIKSIGELPHLTEQNLKNVQNKKLLIVSDIGFTDQFEQKIIETVRNIKERVPNSESIEVFRANLLKPEVAQLLKQSFGANLKDQTIFLMKNNLENNLVNVQFDMYMQYPSVLNTYLTDIKKYEIQNQTQYLRRLEHMGPNQSCLMYIYDNNESEGMRTKRLLAAKYIEMELALHHLEGLKVLPVEASVVRENKIIPDDKIRANSLHIVRKHNQFTHANPNLYMKFQKSDNYEEIVPFHLLADIGFHNKRGEVAVQHYLSKIETFNSLSISTPYVLSVTVDRNRVTVDTYNKIMETFKQLRRQNKFPEVAIAMKYAQVGYLGKNQPENTQFVIKMANVAELQNQSYMHQIQRPQDAQNLGITSQNWLRQSYEYLYPHQVVSQQLITNFIEKVVTNAYPQYYRSDKPSPIQNVNKIVGTNFHKQILQNELDHFIFEYSDHCPSCKMISPLIGYMNQVLAPIPIEKRFDIHKMNCQKNRPKGQMYSPYTPSMNYYKNEWKKTGPVKIPLEALSGRGLPGLYDFCVITKTVKSLDIGKFSQAIQNAAKWDKSEFLL